MFHDPRDKHSLAIADGVQLHLPPFKVLIDQDRLALAYLNGRGQISYEFRGVLDYLHSMQDETARIIAGLSNDQLKAKVATVGGVEMRAWKWLRLMIEHEIHHRGQLYSVLGQMGVATLPLYGLTEPEVEALSE